MDPTDDQILAAVLAGDVNRYAEIVRRYQEDVWQIASFCLRDLAATEDLVQQVFVAAFLALDRYEPGRDFGPWLRTIARNEVRKELRTAIRNDRKLALYGRWVDESFADPLEAEQRDRIMREALRRCREELADPAVQALRLRYEDGLDFGEIAARLGRSIAAARQLLQRTRLVLRQCVEKRMVAS